MRRVGLLLAGCGAYDGTDPREASLLLLLLLRRNYRVLALAPDVPQPDVVDHTTGHSEENPSPRSVLSEAARLVRGRIRALHELRGGELEGLVIPGGMGAVKVLLQGGPGPLPGGDPLPDVARLLNELREYNAPVATVGLGDVVLARHVGRPLRADAANLAPGSLVEDPDGTLYTPGFLATDDYREAARGIERLVDALAVKLG